MWEVLDGLRIRKDEIIHDMKSRVYDASEDRERFAGGATYLAVILVFVVAICTKSALAFELYKTFQTPEVFLKEVFKGDVPAPKIASFSSDDQEKIAKVFKRNFPQQRLRYWEGDDKTVWVFDDIGKEGYVPTTCGFVIRNGVVETAKVLIYRESRGEQVAEPSFLNQINGASADGSGLNVEVDNITGATLSVQMMERMASTALAFDSIVR